VRFSRILDEFQIPAFFMRARILKKFLHRQIPRGERRLSPEYLSLITRGRRTATYASIKSHHPVTSNDEPRAEVKFAMFESMRGSPFATLSLLVKDIPG
jgi:hypothetical protein